MAAETSLHSFRAPNNINNVFQTNLANARVGLWTARGNATTAMDAFGMLPPTIVGTATKRSVATTTYFTEQRRLGVVSATANAGDFAEAYCLTEKQWFRSTNQGRGGFRFTFMGGISDAATVAGATFFAGLIPSGVALTDVDPTTLTDCVGFAQIAGSSNINFVYNDASGTASTFDLGANFPAGTLSVDWYVFTIDCPPGDNNTTPTIYWTATRRNTGDFASGSITTDLPTANTLLAPHVFRCNHSTALAIAFDIAALKIESVG